MRVRAQHMAEPGETTATRARGVPVAVPVMRMPVIHVPSMEHKSRCSISTTAQATQLPIARAGRQAAEPAEPAAA
jgi:hypothetical protein